MTALHLGAALTTAALCAGLLGSPPPAPDEDEPYTAMNGYVASLVYWHLHPDWGFGPATSTPPLRGPA